MAYNVLTTPEFEAQLDEAIAFRLENHGRRSARKLINEVERASSLLSGQPFMGSLVIQEDEEAASDALRWVRADAYIIVYRPHERDGVVALDKLFYASSNWRERIAK